MAKRAPPQQNLPLFGNSPAEAEDESSAASVVGKLAHALGTDSRIRSKVAPRYQPGRAVPPQADVPTVTPDANLAATDASEPKVVGVAQLDRALKNLLENHTANVRVRGEVTSLHRASSGHAYFSLKDENEDALIECAMYRSAPARARKQLAEGESVVLVGRVTVYPPRGRMQLIADDVLQTARGALLEALERLKAKLAAEGLFDPERKKPLPADPQTIAVLTSRDGAAIHDVIRVAFRRGRVKLRLVPTPVQGAGAAERIAAAIALTDGLADVDVILVTRGGGSAEDLAAYNDEKVVRAIAAARLPVVSAVGHEIDVSLGDLAADARAATPSQAAELLVADHTERMASVTHLRTRLQRAMDHRITTYEQHLTRLRAALGEPRRLVLEQAQRFDELTSRLERSMNRRIAVGRASLQQLERRLARQHPREVMALARVRLTPLRPRLLAAMRERLSSMRAELATSTGRLEALSPLAVLNRGYAIATTESGAVLRDARQTTAGDALNLRLHRGRLAARVEKTEPEASEVD